MLRKDPIRAWLFIPAITALGLLALTWALRTYLPALTGYWIVTPPSRPVAELALTGSVVILAVLLKRHGDHSTMPEGNQLATVLRRYRQRWRRNPVALMFDLDRSSERTRDAVRKAAEGITIDHDALPDAGVSYLIGDTRRLVVGIEVDDVIDIDYVSCVVRYTDSFHESRDAHETVNRTVLDDTVLGDLLELLKQSRRPWPAADAVIFNVPIDRLNSPDVTEEAMEAVLKAIHKATALCLPVAVVFRMNAENKDETGTTRIPTDDDFQPFFLELGDLNLRVFLGFYHNPQLKLKKAAIKDYVEALREDMKRRLFQILLRGDKLEARHENEKLIRPVYKLIHEPMTNLRKLLQDTFSVNASSGNWFLSWIVFADCQAGDESSLSLVKTYRRMLDPQNKKSVMGRAEWSKKDAKIVRWYRRGAYCLWGLAAILICLTTVSLLSVVAKIAGGFELK